MSELFPLTAEDIKQGLAPYIASGRIQGQIVVDGVLIVDTDLQNVVDPIQGEYDEHGLSYETSNKCVRIKLIDEAIAELLEGDEIEQAVAKAANQWHGLWIPERYDDNDDEWKNIANNTRGAFMFGFSGPYITQFNLFGRPIENHVTIGWQNFAFPNAESDPGNVKWYQHMTVDIVPFLLEELSNALNRARAVASGGTGPNVSPWGR